MPQYRRSRQPNSRYFFTVVTHDRNHIFASEFSRECLREAFRTIQRKYFFTIDGMVLLPDHLHAIWSLPEDDSNFSMRWNLIKNRFTRLYLQTNPGVHSVSHSRIQKREQGIWQRRFWEHLIRDDEDFFKHLEYIHYNPVKHGYVRNPADWEWTSFHRYVKLGWYEKDWGSQEPEAMLDSCAGE